FLLEAGLAFTCELQLAFGCHRCVLSSGEGGKAIPRHMPLWPCLSTDARGACALAGYWCTARPGASCIETPDGTSGANHRSGCQDKRARTPAASKAYTKAGGRSSGLCSCAPSIERLCQKRKRRRSKAMAL